MTDYTELRDRLLQQRRERLGRNGSLGPTIKALHDVATLIELNTLPIYRRGQERTDYHLIMRACLGPLMWRDHKAGRWEIARVRTHRAEYAAADVLIDNVIAALGPQYDGKSLAELKAITDQLAIEAMAARAATRPAAEETR